MRRYLRIPGAGGGGKGKRVPFLRGLDAQRKARSSASLLPGSSGRETGVLVIEATDEEDGNHLAGARRLYGELHITGDSVRWPLRLR
jgi:hypothetical protein